MDERVVARPDLLDDLLAGIVAVRVDRDQPAARPERFGKRRDDALGLEVERGARAIRLRGNDQIVVGRNAITRSTNSFHATIYAGAHNDYLAEMTFATRTRVQPFRRAQFRLLGRLAKSHVEHDQVVEAILRGDRAGAFAAMHAHIITVGEEYEAYALSL